MVTAIVPNYNHARFLERRLESIYRQSYPHLRVILLDDASTDNSRVILETYRNHPRTQAIVYNDANSGSPFLQWQKGLALAATDWVWIAESDDWCEKDFLQSLLPALDQPDCVMAYALLHWANEAGEIIKQAPTEKESWYHGNTFVNSHLLENNRLHNAGMLIFRKRAALNADTRWLHMRQAGDYWLWAEVAAQGRVFGCGKALCYMTKHPQSVTALHYATASAQQEVTDTWWRMLEMGTVTRGQLQNRIKKELVGLLCIRKGIDKEIFKQRWDIWKQLLVKAGGGSDSLHLHYLAYKAKFRHRKMTPKKWFSVF